MKKRILILSGLLLIIVISIFIFKYVSNNSINDLEPYSYYANVFDYNIPGKTYTLQLWEKGWYELEIVNGVSAVDLKNTSDNYEGYLEYNEMQKIKCIFEYLNNKYLYDKHDNKNIRFYLDFNNGESKVSFEDNNILFNTLLAIKYINTGDKSRGNKILDETLQLCN